MLKIWTYTQHPNGSGFIVSRSGVTNYVRAFGVTALQDSQGQGAGGDSYICIDLYKYRQSLFTDSRTSASPLLWQGLRVRL